MKSVPVLRGHINVSLIIRPQQRMSRFDKHARCAPGLRPSAAYLHISDRIQGTLPLAKIQSLYFMTTFTHRRMYYTCGSAECWSPRVQQHKQTPLRGSLGHCLEFVSCSVTGTTGAGLTLALRRKRACAWVTGSPSLSDSCPSSPTDVFVSPSYPDCSFVLWIWWSASKVIHW